MTSAIKDNKKALTECKSEKGKVQISAHSIAQTGGNVKRGSVVCPICHATFPEARYIYTRCNDGIVGCNVCLECYKAEEVYERC